LQSFLIRTTSTQGISSCYIRSLTKKTAEGFNNNITQI